MNKTAANQLSTPVQGLRRRFLILIASLGLAVGGMPVLAAQTPPDPKGAPDTFVRQIAENALEILKNDPELKNGNIRRVNQVIDEHLLPYVDFEKTTRLAAARYWREATPAQREALTREFRGTLVRTYSGAFSKVAPDTTIVMLPFRGDAKADDVVVRTQVKYGGGNQPAAVDYRLERNPEGWKVYDVSVEGIWLIQNYRNQFATQIQQSGMDGLIKALAERNE